MILLRALLCLALAGCAAPSRFTRAGFEVPTFTHDATNAHLVVKDGAAFLFDTGYEKNAALLEADVRAAGIDYQCDLELNRANVKRVLDELAPSAQLYFGPVTRDAVSEHFK